METASEAWERPFCGSEYGLEYVNGIPQPNRKVAGDPVVCDKSVHENYEMHFNSELAFGWWGSNGDLH